MSSKDFRLSLNVNMRSKMKRRMSITGEIVPEYKSQKRISYWIKNSFKYEKIMDAVPTSIE